MKTETLALVILGGAAVAAMFYFTMGTAHASEGQRAPGNTSTPPASDNWWDNIDPGKVIEDGLEIFKNLFQMFSDSSQSDESGDNLEAPQRY